MAYEGIYHRTLAALNALYRDYDPVKRNEANAYCIRFRNEQAAWNVSIRLLNEAKDLTDQYYGASTIYYKVKKDWPDLNGDMKAKLYNVVKLNLSKRCSMGNPSYLTDRLALSAAYIIIHAKQSLPQEIAKILTDKTNNVSFKLSLLSAFPEELQSANLSHLTLQNMRQSLKSDVSPVVLEFLKHIVIDKNTPSGIVSRTLSCLRGWLHVGVGIVQLRKGGWFAILKDRMATHLDECFNVWTEMIDLSTGQSLPKSVAKALDESIGYISLACEKLYSTAANVGDRDTCNRVAIGISEIGSLAIDVIKFGSEYALRFVSMILTCMKSKDLKNSEVTLEFWLSLQDIELEERHPKLGRPVYTDVTKVLFERIQYYKDTDPSELHIYRSKSVDILISSFGLLNMQFFEYLRKLLQSSMSSPVSWRPAEATAFILIAIHVDLLERCNSSGQALSSNISLMVSNLVKISLQTQQLMLCFSTLQVLRYYAPIVANDKKLREDIIKFIAITSTAKPSVQEEELFAEEGKFAGFKTAVGNAFKSIMHVCGRNLAPEMKSLVSLVNFVHGKNPKLLDLNNSSSKDELLSKDEMACRTQFVTALVKLAADLGADGATMVEKLVTPLKMKLGQLAKLTGNKSVPMGKLHACLVQRIELLRKVLMVLFQSKKMAASIINFCWPALKHLMTVDWNFSLKHIPEEKNLGFALCNALETEISLGIHTHLSEIVEGMKRQYLASQSHDCLRVLHKAVTMFGGRDTQRLFQSAFIEVGKPTVSMIRKVSDKRLHDHHEMVTEFLKLCEAMFRKFLLLIIDLLDPLLEILSNILLHVPVRNTVRAALKFLDPVLKSAMSHESESGRKALQSLVLKHGGRITQSIMLCIARRDTAAPGTLAASLFGMLKLLSKEKGVMWLQNALSDNKFYGRRISIEDRKKIIQKAVKIIYDIRKERHCLPEGKFRALMVDFSQTCEYGGRHVDLLDWV